MKIKEELWNELSIADQMMLERHCEEYKNSHLFSLINDQYEQRIIDLVEEEFNTVINDKNIKIVNKWLKIIVARKKINEIVNNSKLSNENKTRILNYYNKKCDLQQIINFYLYSYI